MLAGNVLTSQEREKIYSNDYADLLINYSGDLSVLEQFKNDTVNIINYFYAVVHVPVNQITEDFISKMGYSTMPLLFGTINQSSLEASGILRIRSIPKFELRGKGVLIGIADTGIDYTNSVFQYSDKTTKIESIWDQTIDSEQIPESISYGTEYSRNQINEALKSNDPFQIVPSKDEVGHGTMLAGIAAGNEVQESGFFGVAPDAELVVVKLKPAKNYVKQFFRIPENELCFQDNDLLFAYQYLINYAAKINKPIVICNAVDSSQYAHDGRGLASSYLSFQAKNPGTAILLAVGNEGNAKRHYFGKIDSTTGYDTVELKVGENESGFSMEVWGNSPNIYSIDILSPSGEYVPRIQIRLNETREISFIFDQTIIYIDYQLVEAQSGDQLILLRFTKPTKGIWKFKVYGRGIYPMNFHIWLPMNHFITADTFFIKSDPYVTLLSLSCAMVPISVTAYNIENNSIYMEAGNGYTRIDIIKPDIAAPGVNILSPSLNHDFTEVSGTSAAVAHTAGAAALLLEWGIIKGNYPKMSTQDMKVFMIRGARRDPNITYPNQEWGYGILDMYKVFDSLRKGK